MTGRAAGYCAGFSVPGFMNPAVPWGFGRGFGRGGGGRGFRRWFYATGLPGWARWGALPAWGSVPWYGPWAPPAHPIARTFAGPSREEELELLKRQAESLTDALEEIRKRIAELESQTSEKAER